MRFGTIESEGFLKLQNFVEALVCGILNYGLLLNVGTHVRERLEVLAGRANHPAKTTIQRVDHLVVCSGGLIT